MAGRELNDPWWLFYFVRCCRTTIAERESKDLWRLFCFAMCCKITMAGKRLQNRTCLCRRG